MKKLKVLIIGSAFAADLHSEGYDRLREKVEVVGICDRNSERGEVLKERYGFHNAVIYDDYEVAIREADCDVVDICMPNHLHHPVALLAFEKDRHVICEKPLATTVEQAQEMVDAAEKANKKLYYAEDWLFAPAFLKAINIVESGQLGRPLYIRTRECHNGSHSPFAQTIEYCGGGAMVHLGVHPVALVLALKDGKWKNLVAMKSGGLENNIVHHQMEGEDWAAALMSFEDGTFATLEANYITVGGMEDILDIYCERGVIHVDIAFQGPIRCFSETGLDYTVEKANVTTGWSTPAVDEKYNLGYVDEIAHFVECALNDEDAKVGLRGVDGLEALRVINYIYRSADEGRSIAADEVAYDR
ncbi:MAG TPA: Gfo/Idh/MocA family oxidoreductase [Fastidiosipila sp.]|nr:Gfo/Idh/MocA family oxidoreductase [Eubacteriales bacterium]MDD3611732.1 Gfo/Idh/MocA family oxidoreductase [Eubacteriales bacterium]HHU03920.1 Gfo/Idh/MocA family oxidoreductase [Fastidiosipila sp.]